MRLLKVLAVVLGLAAPAAALPPYYGVEFSTVTGRASMNLTGTLKVAASSSSPAGFTILLDGVKGGVSASSGIFTYGITAGSLTVTNGVAISSALSVRDLTVLYGLTAATGTFSQSLVVGFSAPCASCSVHAPRAAFTYGVEVGTSVAFSGFGYVDKTGLRKKAGGSTGGVNVFIEAGDNSTLAGVGGTLNLVAGENTGGGTAAGAAVIAKGGSGSNTAGGPVILESGITSDCSSGEQSSTTVRGGGIGNSVATGGSVVAMGVRSVSGGCGSPPHTGTGGDVIIQAGRGSEANGKPGDVSIAAGTARLSTGVVSIGVSPSSTSFYFPYVMFRSSLAVSPGGATAAPLASFDNVGDMSQRLAATFGSSVTVAGWLKGDSGATVAGAVVLQSSVTMLDGQAIGGAVTFRSTVTVKDLLATFGVRSATASFTSGLVTSSLTVVGDSIHRDIANDKAVRVTMGARPTLQFTDNNSASLANGAISAADLWLNSAGGNITSWGLHSFRSTVELTSGQAITNAATFTGTMTARGASTFTATGDVTFSIGTSSGISLGGGGLRFPDGTTQYSATPLGSAFTSGTNTWTGGNEWRGSNVFKSSLTLMGVGSCLGSQGLEYCGVEVSASNEGVINIGYAASGRFIVRNNAPLDTAFLDLNGAGTHLKVVSDADGTPVEVLAINSTGTRTNGLYVSGNVGVGRVRTAGALNIGTDNGDGTAATGIQFGTDGTAVLTRDNGYGGLKMLGNFSMGANGAGQVLLVGNDASLVFNNAGNGFYRNSGTGDIEYRSGSANVWTSPAGSQNIGFADTSPDAHVEVKAIAADNYLVQFSSVNDVTKIYVVDKFGHFSSSAAVNASLGTCTNGTLVQPSNDVSGKVSFSGANTSCAVNFANAYPSAGNVVCTTSAHIASFLGYDTVATTTGLTFTTAVSTIASGDSISYDCRFVGM